MCATLRGFKFACQLNILFYCVQPVLILQDAGKARMASSPLHHQESQPCDLEAGAGGVFQDREERVRAWVAGTLLPSSSAMLLHACPLNTIMLEKVCSYEKRDP